MVPGPRVYSTGPGVGYWMYNLKSLGANQKCAEAIQQVLNKYAIQLRCIWVRKIVNTVSGLNQWLRRSRNWMPTTEGGSGFQIEIWHSYLMAILGQWACEFPIYHYNYSDVPTRTIAKSKMAVYPQPCFVAYGGLGRKTIITPPESPLHDPKLNRFTPYEELNLKLRRRRWIWGGWLQPEDHVFWGSCKRNQSKLVRPRRPLGRCRFTWYSCKAWVTLGTMGQ